MLKYFQLNTLQVNTLQAGKEVTVTVYEKLLEVKGTQFVMVYIPAGEFEMGSDEDDSEKPIHRVKIEKAFYMGKFPVTQRQWQTVMGKNPSYFEGDNLPVETVSWYDCIEFCERLSSQTNKAFRLPSEAEWEYACRAGAQSRYWWGDSMDDSRCWYSGNSRHKTHAVDEKVNEHTNAFGLCDMLGNVYEWTHSDSDYSAYIIPSYDGRELVLSRNNESKIIRGGTASRSAYRSDSVPDNQRDDLGFRVVLISPDSVFIPSQKPLLPVRTVENSSISKLSTVQVPTSSPVLFISDIVRPIGKPPTQTFLQKIFGILVQSFQSSGTAINIEMVLIPPGEFEMGSNERNNEEPIHRVKIEKAFYMGKYPVTQRQWEAVMGNNPSYFKGENLPVEQVSWHDCIEFCERLSSQTNKVFRLPSEAEWEYACRAGTQSRYWWGDSMDDNRCWYCGNSGHKTHAVDEKVNEHTNAFGLCDMLGSVYEWTHSDYSDYSLSYDGSEMALSRNTYKAKVVRGGSWFHYSNQTRSATRQCGYPANDEEYPVGFRIVLISP